MTSKKWIIGFFFLLASCQKDPYRYYLLEDGFIKPDAAPSDGLTGDGIPTETAPTDLFIPTVDRRRFDLSYDTCVSLVEVCNGEDDNCNGKIDEIFDKETDWRYCDNCKGCQWLLSDKTLHVALPGCAQGKCTIQSCSVGFIDKDGDIKNGCEVPCSYTGLEICDGDDNDCNGAIDDGVAAPLNLCLDIGPCKNSETRCMGKEGWQCVYKDPDVELQPCNEDKDCASRVKCDLTRHVCPGVVIINETKCDGKDNDCDAVPDDPWDPSVNPSLPVALGNECDLDDPPKKGICRNVGKYVCDPANSSQTKCELVTAAQPPKDETCNGADDDCDGLVDERTDDAAGKGVFDATVSINKTAGGKSYNFTIFAYEASRPDATTSSSGINSEAGACSIADRIPWNVVSKEEAAAACTRVGPGYRLCTSEEWSVACRSDSQTAYPYGANYDATKCNGKDYDTDGATAGNQDELLPANEPATCVSAWPGGNLYNMSGNLREWTLVSAGGKVYEIKGGAYDTPAITGFSAGLSCDYVLPEPTQTLRLYTLGFRCCKPN